MGQPALTHVATYLPSSTETMFRFMAWHMIAVRMAPLDPMSAPTTVSRGLFSMKPCSPCTQHTNGISQDAAAEEGGSRGREVAAALPQHTEPSHCTHAGRQTDKPTDRGQPHSRGDDEVAACL